MLADNLEIGWQVHLTSKPLKVDEYEDIMFLFKTSETLLIHTHVYL